MDFSGAQLAAHSEEYADLMMSLAPGADKLVKQAYDTQRAFYLAEANESQWGCEVHFFRSGCHLKQNGALIMRELGSRFEEILYIMTSPSINLEDFESAVIELHSSFPRIEGWLEWWLRPKIASMIFPVCSQIDPEVLRMILRTSNPVEAQHSILHSAMGTGHDAIEGVEKLYLYVKEKEKHFNAIIGKYIFLTNLVLCSSLSLNQMDMSAQ